MLKRFLIALGVLLLIIAIIFYYKLGGSKELDFEIISREKTYVIGEHFKGKPNDPKIEKLFLEARARAKKDAYAALTVVNYQTDEDNKTIEQFIGSATLKKPHEIPDHLQMLEIPAHTAVFTIINAHNFVMPTPEKVRAAAQTFASKNNQKLDTLSLETYISDRELRISFPLKRIDKK